MHLPPFEDFLKYIVLICSFLGIPLGVMKVHVKFYIFLLEVTLMLAGEVCFCIYMFRDKRLLELTQLAPCAAIGALSILKISYIASKQEKVNNLIFSLRNLYERIMNNENRRKIAFKSIRFLYAFLNIYVILNVFLIMIYNFSSLFIMLYHYLEEDEIVYMLPYALLLPFSTDTWFTWIPVYIFSITAGFLCVAFYTSVDLLYYVLTSHVCNHFTLIANELQYFDGTDENELRDIIIRHQYILKLSKDLNEIFTMPNFFNVVVGSLQICALGFNLTIGGPSQIIGVLLFLIIVLLQMFVMCLFGETLMRESERVGDAAYMCLWYNKDIRIKKDILLIIRRSNKIQILTAYKFSDISYNCFTKIISTSWTYFTLLKTVYMNR
ncbi:putative odorant receptor 92a [Battus philenor]|uniref:putative odorant receptor 92a n=1 Tax=Battus philenor TaxID=42288 RepID=UPI0035CEDBB9